VPALAQHVLLKRHGDLAYDVTDEVHPRVAADAALAARVVGLDIAGIDLVAQDISKSLQSQEGAIIEVNAGPGLLMHLKPAEGKPRNVGTAIVAHLFPQANDHRIPIVGVTGTQNTTRIARLVAWLLHISGKQTGLACKDGFFLGARQVDSKDSANWEAGQRLLINRSVEAAVFEHSSRAILAEGLAYDRCSVAVVTDVSGYEDLAEFYIHNTDQLYNVVRTQVDVVLPQGIAVMNASDPKVVEMAELCDGKVIFYGLDESLPVIFSHRAKDERVVFVRDAFIMLAQGMEEVARIPLSSLKPSKAAQPEMVMAAVAAAWALGIAPELINAGLRNFDPTFNKNY
jgi:cyanophycin synthetase